MAAGGFPGWHLLAVFVLGTIVMRSAGCCVNDVADKDFDKHVKRTAVRPVTRGAVSSKEALILGAVLALVAFKAVGCRGVSRVDFRVTPDGKPYVLEINTVPGFTSTSLLPKAAAQAGISFSALCARLVESAACG